jgi:hypothetical protein
MKHIQIVLISMFVTGLSLNLSAADEFVPAYENVGSYKLEDPKKYFAYEEGRTYYTSGKENGFRVNENDEESTDETIGILTLLIAPATIIYMNLVGWWE